ncbi:MarR family winged helix-turn-helix transcriptional regulator [Nakamurella lactea]|uniref:MarR family winged helix-turn-helix transcriptional regulator n=1 Tax=Nakamurella lactea TaxID=459515 RepID=UPI00042835A5|nr:MarR family winged helix-turn-helix transcriptional regulator [Nakamurella lactea]
MGSSNGIRRADGPSAATGDRLGVHLKQTEQLLIAAKTKVLKPLHLTVPQYAALSTIAAGNGISAAQVARACLVTPQTIGAVLANLADRGLIVRAPSPVHSGVLVCTATAAGRRLATTADRTTLAIESRFDALFGRDDRATFVEKLAKIRAILQATIDD